MKYFLFSLLFICSFQLASAQNYFLQPATFFSSRGTANDIGIFYGKGFDTIKAKKVPASQLEAAFLYADRKPVSLLTDTKSSSPFLSAEPDGSGIYLVAAKKSTKTLDIEREELQRELSDDGFEALSEKLEDKDVFNVNNVYFSKALLMASKPSGKFYEEKTGDDLEVILLQNPYKMNYGEDVIAQVLFRGEPLKKARTTVYTRTLNGSIFAGDFFADDDGKINIKLNRAGEWMISCTYITPGDKEQQAKGDDYFRWSASLCFGFRPE